MTPKAFIEHVLSIAATEPSAVLTEIRGLVQTSIITKPVVGLVAQQILREVRKGSPDTARMGWVYWKEAAALRGLEHLYSVPWAFSARCKNRLVDALREQFESIDFTATCGEDVREALNAAVEPYLSDLGLGFDYAVCTVENDLDKEFFEIASVTNPDGKEDLFNPYVQGGIACFMSRSPSIDRPGFYDVSYCAVYDPEYFIEEVAKALDPLKLLDRGAFDRQWRDRDMSEDDLGAIVEALRDAGPFHYGDEDDLLEVALEWLREGFTGDEVEAWTAYPIEGPCWARRLKDRNICPHDLDVAAQDITGDAWIESGSSMATFKRETIYRLAELIVDRGFTLEDAREDLFYIAEIEMSDYVSGRVLG